MLDFCFKFESPASAVLRLKFRGQEPILSRAQSRSIPDFGRESQNIGRENQIYAFLVEKFKILVEKVKKHPISVEKDKTYECFETYNVSKMSVEETEKAETCRILVEKVESELVERSRILFCWFEKVETNHNLFEKGETYHRLVENVETYRNLVEKFET